MYEQIEKVLESSFDREYEQDENLVRSLPFFATALGVVVAIYSQIISHMPAKASLAHMLVELLLVAALGCFLWVLLCLFQAVRSRQYIILSQETVLKDWWHEHVAYQKGRGLTEKNAAKSADLALSNAMQIQYAAAAVHNRAVNLKKFRWRTSGIVWLVALMVLATASVSAIFLDRRFNPHSYEEPNGALAQPTEVRLTWSYNAAEAGAPVGSPPAAPTNVPSR